jgi:hypothetical protein
VADPRSWRLAASDNVNGVNGRLANLLGWLHQAAPDIVCLQELKAPDDKFPAAALHAAGYGAVWHGQKSWNGVAILARGAEPVEIRRGLPGDPDDTHSRYIEAAIGGMLVGCLYLPNGNPAPVPRLWISPGGYFISSGVLSRAGAASIQKGGCSWRPGCRARIPAAPFPGEDRSGRL